MQSILRSTLRLSRRPGVFAVAPGAPRRSPSGLARRDPPLKPVAPAMAHKLLVKLPGFAYEPWRIENGIGVRSEKEEVQLDRTTKVMDETKMNNEIYGNNLMAADGIWRAEILQNSSHHDGSIYKRSWQLYDMDISDRNETVSELKQLSTVFTSHPNEEYGVPSEMVQIFSLSLAKTPNNHASIPLYGYMAARDDMDGKLNYVFNRSRDDPLIVQQGSLIEMTGPKRGIVMISDVLFEFDMRIKAGEKEEDDIQLIDGVIHFCNRMPTYPVALRISGNCGGAVDMSLAHVELGVEAIIEVAISEVRRAFDLSLSSFLSEWVEHKEFQLFHGTVDEMCLKRFVVAVPSDGMMHLKFKVDDDSVHCCPFNPKLHGCTNRQVKFELACISVKVNWSPPLF